MVIIWNKQIYFETRFLDPLPINVKLESLIYDNKITIPLTNDFTKYLIEKDQTQSLISLNVLPKESKPIFLMFNKETNHIELLFKDKEIVGNFYSVALDKDTSYIYSNHTTACDIIFNNLNDYYEETNKDLEFIVNNIFEKSPYMHKNLKGYILDFEDAFNQDLSKIKSFIPKPSTVIYHTLDTLDTL